MKGRLLVPNRTKPVKSKARKIFALLSGLLVDLYLQFSTTILLMLAGMVFVTTVVFEVSPQALQAAFQGHRAQFLILALSVVCLKMLFEFVRVRYRSYVGILRSNM